jgi:glycerol-3-phosphate O-acyltransferase
MLDEVSAAVLAREEVVEYLRGGYGEQSEAAARERVNGYLDELRTTQRYHMYRALQHPLYPILRKIEKIPEQPHHALDATRHHRVVYASNHKSHLDYLVEPIVLDDSGVRPPLIAAGINLFGGPLGLIHKYVTGAIPIRRNTKDPAYLITLKAYVAEMLKKHDLFLYPEGGRSYSGELKQAKTGLLHAALTASTPNLVILPVAIAYDLVLEDHILARQGVKKTQRPFTRELAEMVRYAVGYRSRVFVTFGAPIPADGVGLDSRSDVLAFAKLVRERIGRLYKVLPTALFAASMKPSTTRKDLETRIDRLLELLNERQANLAVTSGRDAVDAAAELLETRGIIVYARGRFRVRNRGVLRYYAHTLDHFLETPGRTH